MILFGIKLPTPVQLVLMRNRGEISVQVVHEQFTLTTSLRNEFGGIDQLARNTLLHKMVVNARHRMIIELSVM